MKIIFIFYMNCPIVLKIKGRSISVGHLSKTLKSGYLPSDQQLQDINGYSRDGHLSDDYAQVYYHPEKNHAIISHRGTAPTVEDWANNAEFMADSYESTDRYKHAKDIQEKTEEKYGAKNVSTIGHSQGAMLAEKLGSNSKESIGFNRPVNTHEIRKLKTTKKNHYDIRTARDPVSVGQRMQYQSNDAVIIPSVNYFNLAAEHQVDTLDRLNENRLIGEGLKKHRTTYCHR